MQETMNWFTTYDLLKREGPFTLAPDYIVWYIVVGLVAVAGIYLLNRYKTEKRVKIVLIVLWAITVALDTAKLILNICTGFGINGDMPLYICSLFMYIMPVAIWGKGKFRAIAAAYICTINLFGVIGNYIVPSVIKSYSLFSFRGFHTTLYHTVLVITPFVMLCTGSYRMKFKDFGWQMLGFVVVTLPVIPFNYLTDSNYMYFNDGIFIESFAEKVSYAWPLFAYFFYAAIMLAMQALIFGITKLVELIMAKLKKDKPQPAVAEGEAPTGQAAEQETEKTNEQTE